MRRKKSRDLGPGFSWHYLDFLERLTRWLRTRLALWARSPRLSTALRQPPSLPRARLILQ
jgi:hypothetical protein